jgi:thiosulfate reductase cytochrome b subunit
MGGLTARLVHFFAMAAIVAFLVVHIGIAVAFQRRPAPMFTGRGR